MAVETFKAETCRFLRLAAPTDEEIAAGHLHPPGFIHLPRGTEAEWVKQLVAEQLVTVRTRRGFTRLEWQKMRERNEALDCRTYARAAAWILGLDRWTDEHWRRREEELAAEREAALAEEQADHLGAGATAPAGPGDDAEPPRDPVQLRRQLPLRLPQPAAVGGGGVVKACRGSDFRQKLCRELASIAAPPPDVESRPVSYAP